MAVLSQFLRVEQEAAEAILGMAPEDRPVGRVSSKSAPLLCQVDGLGRTSFQYLIKCRILKLKRHLEFICVLKAVSIEGG